ncbi:hypothetical protein [Chryseobacterium sp.]|uniref:hypothetical protein n=1 Tax=Chryseobacterium sp. TaxID=1871047 RepID=UPI002FCA862F
MKAKIFYYFVVTLLFVQCKKGESTFSKVNDTLGENLSDSIQVDSNRTKDGILTFEKLPKEEYETYIVKYDKIFKNTDLKRKGFFINKASFDSVVKNVIGKKDFLDIYFIIDDLGERNIVFNFTNQVDIVPKYKFDTSDEQYTLDKGILKRNDSFELEQHVKKYIDEYQSLDAVKQNLQGGKLTILSRDKVRNISNYATDFILEEIVNNQSKIALAFKVINENGETEFYNRGQQWP